jgi:HSP20 family protein
MGAARTNPKEGNMALMHWDPFRAIRRRDDMGDDFFRDFFRNAGDGALEPAVEVSESDGEVTVKLEVPGVDKDQVSVSVADDVLTVRGEVRKEKEEKKKNFYRQEIRYGSFERSLKLPTEVEGDRGAAELKNGMLTITLPKSRQPKAHQVKVAIG